MNRRQVFGGAVAAPAILAATAASGGSRDRVSTEQGDPGERRYAELCGDGLAVRVFLDGVEQKDCVTADPGLGLVKRPVRTARGNIAINHATGEIHYETVHGHVRCETFTADWMRPPGA